MRLFAEMFKIKLGSILNGADPIVEWYYDFVRSDLEVEMMESLSKIVDVYDGLELGTLRRMYL